jgi:hypothetical protein
MIEDRDVPAETVRAFAEHLEAEIGVRFVTPFPAWLSAYFSIVGMSPSGVTIGRTIYTSRPLGPTLPGWSGWAQIVALTHEVQHALQGAGRSLLERAIDYAGSTARRTETETECLSAEMELEHWRRGEIARWWFAARASALGAYHVKDVDLAVCERHLRAHAPTVRRSGYVTHAGRVAIQWLDNHAPELRHPSIASRGVS